MQPEPAHNFNEMSLMDQHKLCSGNNNQPVGFSGTGLLEYLVHVVPVKKKLYLISVL